MRTWNRPIVLASSSPRRVQLLSESGIDVLVTPPQIDDGLFSCGSISVSCWVKCLAVMKAQNVKETQNKTTGTVLAADTVCVIDDVIIGQPDNAIEAEKMLQSMANRDHEVCTGWCLLSLEDETIYVGCDVATIKMGVIPEHEISKYISTQQWQGKAGGYNLSERIESGWPIECDGDPTSVMGLPMVSLLKELAIG